MKCFIEKTLILKPRITGIFQLTEHTLSILFFPHHFPFNPSINCGGIISQYLH